jgi:Icc-related predicted phosphoesterase
VRLLVISDIHGQTDMLRRLLMVETKADLMIIAGDITNFGGYESAARVMEPILAKGIPTLAVTGNCDTENVEQYLSDHKINLSGNCFRQGNCTFIGVSGSLPCPGVTPKEYGDDFFENELHKALRQGQCNPPMDEVNNLVVVTHQPAYGANVDIVGGIHRGSQTIRKFIETHKPILAISGHIHEAFGKDSLGPTTLINPGPLKQGRYAIVEIEGHEVRVELHNIEKE